MSILSAFKNNFHKKQQANYTLDEFLMMCKETPEVYASPAQRLLKAIGQPIMVDTSTDTRLSRIFLNRTIKVYPAFEDFYGIEDVIERIVAYLTAASQGLEEKKQILYLLGPVGSSKSSIAERLKKLMEQEPFYALSFKDELSPVYESPFGLFTALNMEDDISKEFNIPKHIIERFILSPWGVKRLEQAEGDLSQFKVVKLYPNKLTQVGIAKTEPGDDNNADIATLVGKCDIRKLEHFSQNDPDAYSFSGALCKGNNGLVEFVEIWKSPIKSLHPLLTATQEGHYCGTEALSAIPFQGIILAHSNESEWGSFKNNKANEAFLDRICVIKVPYSSRVTEEIKIYEKLLNSSSLSTAPCAPKTLEMLANFCVLTRLKDHENSNLVSKMKVYDGENIKEKDPNVKSLQEYKDVAGIDECMSGISTRFAFKILSTTFNYDTEEVAADPVHLMLCLENAIKREHYPEETQNRYLGFIREHLVKEYLDFIGNEIQTAYLESYSDYGQNVFSRYISHADHWIQEIDYKDPDTGQLFDRQYLNTELEKIEKASGVVNEKDFRHEVVNFVLRQQAKTGKPVEWTSYEKLKKVIEKKIFANANELLPVISFGTKGNTEDQKKHDEFVQRMVKKGYTPRQIRRLTEWYARVNKG